MKPLIYVAHPFGGNLALLWHAELWVAFLTEKFDAQFWAPWVPVCRHWQDSGDSRKRGLALDLEAIDRSDGVILVGGHMSPGMAIEMSHALAGRDKPYHVQDLTRYQFPDQLLTDTEQMDFQHMLFGEEQ